MKPRIFNYPKQSIEQKFGKSFADHQEDSKSELEKLLIVPIDIFFENKKIFYNDDEKTKEFDAKIRKIAERLIPGYDFSRCDFLLEDSNDPNAFITRRNEKSFIVLTKGLIDFVKNEDELAYVLGHELTHHLLGDELGEGLNSRIEEGIADLKPIELLHDAGYDARQAYEISKRISPMVAVNLFDIHGKFSDRVLMVKNLVAGIDNRVGGLKKKPKNLRMSTLVKEMNFESFLEKAQKEEGYQNKSLEEKIEFLTKHVHSLSAKHTARIEDYEKLIANLPPLSEKELELFAQLGETFTNKLINPKNTEGIEKIKDRVVTHYETGFEKILLKQEGSVVELARVLSNIPEWYEKIGTFNPVKNLIARQQINDNEDLRMFNMVVGTYAKKFEEKLYYAVANRYVDFLNEEVKKSKKLDERYLIIGNYLKDIPEWMDQKKGVPGIAKVFKYLLDGTPESRARYEKWVLSLNGGPFWNEAQKVLDETSESSSNLLKKETGRNLKPLGTLEKETQVKKLKDFLNRLPEEVMNLENLIKKAKGEDSASVALEQSRDANKKVMEDIKRGMTSLVRISPDDARAFFPEFLEKLANEISGMARLEVTTGVQYLQMITSLSSEILPTSQKLETLNAADLVTIQMESDLARMMPEHMSEDWQEEDFDQFLEQRGAGLNLESYIYNLFHVHPKSISEIISLHGEIKKEHEGFANDFLRVQFLNKLEKFDSTIDVFELVKALDENPTQLKPMLTDADEFIAKALAYQIVNEHRWPNNLSDLASFYEILNKKNFFPTGNDARERMAQKIIDQVEALGTGFTAKIEILKSLYRGPRMSDPAVRNRLSSVFVSLVENNYGKDDGSVGYREKIEEVGKFIEQINIIDRYALSQSICDTIVSQEETSFRFRDVVIGKGVSRESLIEDSIEVMRKEFYYEVFDVHTNKEKTINFLLTPLTLESAQDIADDVARKAVNPESELYQSFMGRFGSADNRFIKKKTTDFASLFYQNFWSSSFLVRTAIIDKMIHEQGQSNDEEDEESEEDKFGKFIEKQQNLAIPAWERGYSMITEKLIPPEDPYKKEIDRFLRSYLDVIPEYQKSLFLCALMTAQQKSQETNKFEAGKVLANILELLGPAEIKAGQVAHSFPDTPQDIANGLGRLKSKADVPTRWEIFELRNKLIPQEIISRIARTEQVHAASINITAHVVENDGSERILIFERENAKERIDEGFDRLSKMANNLGGEEMQTIKEILDEAKQLTSIEIDEESNLKQSEIAFKNYNGITLEGPMSFDVKTPTVYFYGDRYEYMDYMKGSHFNDLPENSPEEKEVKKTVAKAYLALEFAMTLSGAPTDRDRHGDNVRIDTVSQQIGLFDFGGLDIEPPSQSQKEILFDVFSEVFSGASESGMLNVISDSIDTMITNHPTEKSFLRRQEQRFLALGDYLKVLDFNDVQDVFFTALKTNNLDPVFEQKFMEKFGADKNALNALPSSMVITKKPEVGEWEQPKKILVPITKEKIRVIPDNVIKKKK